MIGKYQKSVLVTMMDQLEPEKLKGIVARREKLNTMQVWLWKKFENYAWAEYAATIFYLGLQESNFNTRAVAPPIRIGIAKGPWQFIPSTASEYGLQNGPLVAYEKYDSGDDRHNFEKGTVAAAKCLNHIYTTKAQASGLVVMASFH